MITQDHAVKIGAYPFRLDDREQSYQQSFVPRDGTRYDIPGRPGDRNLQLGLAFWGRDNWIGGEGGVKFSTDEPDLYDQGKVNPRIPGQLQGPPTRTDSTITPAAITTWAGPFLTNSHGHIFLAGDEKVWHSINGSTWTAISTGLPGGYKITSITSDNNNLYVYGHNNPRGVGQFQIYALQVGTAAQQVFSNGSGFADTQHAVFEKMLYAWTGNRLMQTDLTQSWPIAPSSATMVPVYSIFKDNVPPAGSYFGITATDASVVYFISNTGLSAVYEYRGGVGSKLFDLPTGFLATCIAYSLGVVLVAGTFESQAALYGMSMVDQDPQPIGYIREDETFTPVSASAGPGSQFLIGCSDGSVFVYDPAQDAISCLDQRVVSGATLTAVGNYGSKRMAAWADSSATRFRASAWALDRASTTASWDLRETFWNVALPEETKTLHGVHVDFKPFTASETLIVSYQLDENGAWVALPTVTSATTDVYGGNAATNGRLYLTVSNASSTVKFNIIRLKYQGTGGAVVYSVAPRFDVINYQTEWDLALRIEDSVDIVPSYTAEQLYDFLFKPGTGIVPTKAIVSFSDGRPYAKTGTDGSNTYTVKVVSAQFNSARNRGIKRDESLLGVANLKIRSVAP